MANSRKPGPANPPMDWCRIPALTPGPLGLFDQGDPNFTTLLGDTPGPLGMNDWNDPTIGCFHSALATLSWDADSEFMSDGIDGALWPVEPPVNRIASGAHRSNITSKATAAGVASPSAGAVTDFTSVANTRGGYPTQGITEYQGKSVPYTTSFNAATGYWEQSTGDGFLINAISWAPRDAAPASPRSAMSLSMTLQSESLYTAGRSFFGDAYRVAVHEVLNPANTWAIRTGYGLSALVVAIPGFLNDLSRDLYNSPNDLSVGGKKMSAGWANSDPYGFSDGLMRFSMGLLSAAGAAAIGEKGIISNRSANKYAALEAEKAVEAERNRVPSSDNMLNQNGAEGIGLSDYQLGGKGGGKGSPSEIAAKARSEVVAADIVAARQSTASAYYNQLGWDQERIASHLSGIDFSQPVEIVNLSKGLQVIQYQLPGNPVGGYFAPLGTSAESIGVNPVGRIAIVYQVTEDVSVLRSTAADTSANANLPILARGSGGGTQYFSTNRNPFTSIGL